MLRKQNSAAPYDDKLPMLDVDMEIHEMLSFLVTASNLQLTINPKDGKKPYVGSRPESIITFRYLYSYQCRHLVKGCNKQTNSDNLFQFYTNVHFNFESIKCGIITFLYSKFFEMF